MKPGQRVTWNGHIVPLTGPLRQPIRKMLDEGTVKGKVHGKPGVYWVYFDDQSEAMTMHVTELTKVV